MCEEILQTDVMRTRSNAVSHFYLIFTSVLYLARNVQPQMSSVMAGWSERVVLFECVEGFNDLETFQTSVLNAGTSK